MFTDDSAIQFINKYVPSDMKKNIYNPLDVTVIEMQSKVGKDLGGNRWILLNDLKQYGVKVLTDTKVLSVGGNKIDYTVIGDATEPRNIMEALREGYLNVLDI